MSIVIVAGGRDLEVTDIAIDNVCDCLKILGATELACGMARGGDMIGYEAAKKLSIPIKEFWADWRRYGRAAGIIRNGDMGRYARYLVALPGGKGTDHMIKFMQSLDKPVTRFTMRELYESHERVEDHDPDQGSRDHTDRG
jgi:hypothetical protein